MESNSSDKKLEVKINELEFSIKIIGDKHGI